MQTKALIEVGRVFVEVSYSEYIVFIASALDGGK